MASFADALRALNALKADGIVEDYAIAGAMALMFPAHPRDTDSSGPLPGSGGG